MFTQSMTKHVVSCVNEEDGVGVRLGTLPPLVFSIRVSFTCHVSLQAIERPPSSPPPKTVWFQIKYLAQKVRYEYIFLVYEGLYIFPV